MSSSVELWPHQALWGDKLLNGDLVALWWAMRTGKTFTAIHGSRDGDRLIVCPNSVKPVWAKDLALMGEDDVMVWNGKSKRRNRPKNLIVNYESIWRHPDLLEGNWDTVIFDESHRLSNMRTQLWKGIQAALPVLHSNRIIMLSGTPCPEGPHQLITQSILAIGGFDGYTDPWQALRAGWEYNEWNYKWEPKPGTEAKAKAIMHSYGKAMTQAEAGINTKKLYQTLPIEAGAHELKLWGDNYAENMEPMQLAQLAQSCASGRDPSTGTTSGSAKLDAVVEYTKELDQPVVILCHFLSSVEYLCGKLTGAGIKCARICGEDGLGTEGRFALIESFNAGKVRAIVATVPTVKVGLNLSHSNTLLFAENDWGGEARIQSEERATVKGKDAVEIIDFGLTCADEMLGVIDFRIAGAVRGKQDFNAAMLAEKRT